MVLLQFSAVIGLVIVTVANEEQIAASSWLISHIIFDIINTTPTHAAFSLFNGPLYMFYIVYLWF